MTICILGNNLTALTLAKAFVKLDINVDVLYNNEKKKKCHTKTIEITKNNIDYFNKKKINIKKIL